MHVEGILLVESHDVEKRIRQEEQGHDRQQQDRSDELPFLSLDILLKPEMGKSLVELADLVVDACAHQDGD